MLNFILAIFLGWPAIVVAVILAGIGLFRYDYRFILAASFVALPPAWFMSGFPIVRSPVFLMPAFLFTSAWAMRRGREMLAWLLAIPFFLMIFLLFQIVSG